MDNRELLQSFFETLSSKQLQSYKVPLSQFIDYMGIKELALKDINAEFVNQYIMERQFRAIPLKRFKEYLFSFLRFCKIDIDIKQIVTMTKVKRYYGFDDLMDTVELKIEAEVSPYAECASKYDTLKVLICLEWMGLTKTEMSELLDKDVTNDGILIGNKLISYESDRLRTILMQYKNVEGYHTYQADRIKFHTYVNTEYYLKTYTPARTSGDKMNKVYTILRKAPQLNIDNGMIVESARFFKMCKLEEQGVDVLTDLNPNQISNYKEYKQQLKEYMRA